MSHPPVPVIVGVGDVVNRSRDVKDAVEPRALMLEAIVRAIDDTGASSPNDVRTIIDSIDIVASWTWPYDDLPSLLADDLRIKPAHKHIPAWNGGNQPAKLLDAAAKRIASRQCTAAIVCGGEALASLTACAKANMLPPPGWTVPSKSVDSVFSASARELGEDVGGIHGVGLPIQVYPLYENALRAKRGQTLHANNHESALLYASFSKVAVDNMYAWNFNRPPMTEDRIGKVSAQNRMICSPYPLLMNAFNTVNIAGACIVTSTDQAHRLGIPQSQWIYPLGGAGTSDSSKFWERPNFYSSACISRSLDAALQVSGLSGDDVDMFDFYSCFPVVPKLACEHLGLSITNPAKPITLLGGLTSFGGAGNNYSMHAITAMVRRLRSGDGKTGLVLANGGVVSYQHAICLSSKPRTDLSYPTGDVLPEVITDLQVPEIEVEPHGQAMIETYTVQFDRKGNPARGHIVGRLNNGKRFLANHGDAFTLGELASATKEQVGRVGFVEADIACKGRNLFRFVNNSKI